MKRLVSIFFIIVVNQFLISICHPIFTFDFFGSSSTTTEESVISDYRHQKKSDSTFDRINLLKNSTVEDEPSYNENNLEYYAEALGRLIGSVRSSFADLIGDIKKRNQYFRDRNDMKDKQQNSTAEELTLETLMKQIDERLYGPSTNATVDDQEMSKKSKRNPTHADKVGHLTIPINLNFDYDDLLPDEEGTVSDGTSHWLKRYYEFFEQIKENHHSKKEKKIMNIFKLILTPVLQLNKTQSATEESFDNEIMFNIIQGNRTILLTPFQFLRILHKESNDRIQLRMKLLLKRIVYKYARLYYIARKNYKNSHGYYQDIQNDSNDSESDSFRFIDENALDSLDDSEFEQFSKNNSRHNFQTLEGVTILVLEIFGALFALTIGLWSQIEGGWVFADFLE